MENILKINIIKEVLEVNPKVKNEDLLWRADGRLEYICEHNCGHTIYSPREDFIHGCDGCCESIEILKKNDRI